MQGQTASGPCLGASREGSPLFCPSRTGCQGVQGEWRTTTLRVGMKGVGETSLSRAESPLRVWESWTSPKVAAGGRGPGACPWRMRSSNAEPKGRSASYLVSKPPALRMGTSSSGRNRNETLISGLAFLARQNVCPVYAAHQKRQESSGPKSAYIYSHNQRMPQKFSSAIKLREYQSFGGCSNAIHKEKALHLAASRTYPTRPNL
ncbi:hypothetical protein LCGC14_1917190 [marine sediment metagenome]|uniref:Uncharacterized protein n=1 Tax=marine sediment metagenome TaxID=412755 RepID=A0A0F9FSL6_9ZZZZ